MERSTSTPKAVGLLKNRFTYLVICLLVLVGAVGYQLYLNYLRSLPLSYHAKKVFKALDTNDAKTILSYCRKSEKIDVGLTEDSVRKLISWTKEAWDSQPGSDGEIVLDGLARSKTSLLFYRERQLAGRTENPSLGFFLSKSDEGPVITFASPLIKAGLNAKYVSKEEEISSVERMWTSLAIGLRSEMQVLKGFGIKGVVESDSNATFMTLEKLQESAEFVVKDLVRKRNSAQLGPQNQKD